MQDTNALSILLFSQVFNLMVHSRILVSTVSLLVIPMVHAMSTHERQVLKKEKVRFNIIEMQLDQLRTSTSRKKTRCFESIDPLQSLWGFPY